jgi:hypothetical protein
MSFADTVSTVTERLREFWRGPYVPKEMKKTDIPPFQFSSEVVHLVEGNPEKHWAAALPSDGGHICLVDDNAEQLEVPTRKQALDIVRAFPSIAAYRARTQPRH